MWCVPAGALAGVGLIEFNWGGPPYDGGFLGELVLFGGFLALGQAPLVALFVLMLHGRAVGWARDGNVAAGLALSWTLAGFVGWTLGSYFEIFFATPLYSNLRVLAGAASWLLVGVLEGGVLIVALASVEDRRSGSRGSTGALVICGVAWILASTVGRLLYEIWYSFDVAARQNPIKDAVGAYLEDAGVAENVAFEVVPLALFVPILYGIPTGFALIAIGRSISREYS